MSINNGQPVDAPNSNAAWVSKTANDTKIGVLGLNAPGSGAAIVNTQQAINDNIDNINLLDANKINLSEKGAPNGVATLDSLGKIPSSQLTVEIMEYKGVYDASLNLPVLVDGTGSIGDVYRVNVPGTQDYGSGNITFGLGDLVVYNGSVWEKWDVVDYQQETEFRTISGPEAAAKSLTLSQTPVDPSKVLVDIIEGYALKFGVHYTISGNILDFNGYAIENDLEAGDEYRIHYLY